MEGGGEEGRGKIPGGNQSKQKREQEFHKVKHASILNNLSETQLGRHCVQMNSKSIHCIEDGAETHGFNWKNIVQNTPVG